MYDRFEQLVFDSQISATILGNPCAREFVLVELGPNVRQPTDLLNRGFHFIGVTGIVDGAPRTEFAVELDDASLSAIAQAWIQHLAGVIAAKLRPVESAPRAASPDKWGDSEQWLRRLWSLKDPRPDA